MFATILHPTDLSEATIPALKTAHDLAKKLGSRLIVCYIAHPPLMATGETLTDPKTGQSRNITAEVESYQPADPMVEREIRVLVTEQSTGVKSLLQMLRERECDLLVLGMHKRRGITAWLGSSITEEVVRRAECAVLVVKDRSSNSDDEADTTSTDG